MSENKAPKKIASLVLVVDDDLSLRLSMCAALEKFGFRVIEAEDGRQALKAFTESKPDLILLDIMMPGMDGYEACSAIRTLPGGEDLPILMITGLGDEDSASQAFDAGATDFITKPFNWVMLSHRVRYVLRANRAFKDLKISREKLAQAQMIARLGHWEFDLSQKTFNFSAEAFRILELDQTQAETSSDVFFKAVHPDDIENVISIMKNALRDQKPFSVNYRIVLPDGCERFIYNQGEIISGPTGGPEMMLGVVQDVTKQKEAEKHNRFLTFYDRLTGLANQMLFTDRIEQAILKAQRRQGILALFFLDLDRFKRINDTLGHDNGDLLLKIIADRLTECVRKSDNLSRADIEKADSCISRLGGDEFNLLLTDITRPEDATHVAQRLLESIQQPIILDNMEVHVTASIGISVYPLDGEDSHTLMKNADTAMYHAKEKGRNNYQFYEESLNSLTRGRLELENDLCRAFEKGEFELHYQPQVDIKTGLIIGLEALIRWHHPKLGLVPPMKFIPIAEESGLIIPISEWVLQTACRQNKAWQDKGLPPVMMAVNLSSHQFDQQNVEDTVRKALFETGHDPGLLEVELTESVIMQKSETTVKTLAALKELGVRIAIDDFGTGYSSLSYLPAFPIDTLKIDRLFVMDITDQSTNVAIIHAIIAMGHSMNLNIIAEGVETEEHLDLLRQFGCDEAQGYLLSRPVPASEIEGMLNGKSLVPESPDDL